MCRHGIMCQTSPVILPCKEKATTNIPPLRWLEVIWNPQIHCGGSQTFTLLKVWDGCFEHLIPVGTTGRHFELLINITLSILLILWPAINELRPLISWACFLSCLWLHQNVTCSHLLHWPIVDQVCLCPTQSQLEPYHGQMQSFPWSPSATVCGLTG